MANDNSEWQQLNAYADGELPESEARAFEYLLDKKPGMQRDLMQLRELKQRLARLRPSPMEPAILGPARTVQRTQMAAAIAAAVAVTAILSAIAVFLLSEQTTWIAHARALHQEQSTQAFVIEEHYLAQTVSSGHSLGFRPPNLTDSRLYLVNIATPGWGDSEAIALHYRGLSGCRLTIVAIETDVFEAPATAGAATDGLIRTWYQDGFGFAVIADGMDPDRFGAVADYAKSAIAAPKIDSRQMRTAMIERQRNYRPCA